MSLPRENVLLVPNRNVLLTGSGWGGGKQHPLEYVVDTTPGLPGLTVAGVPVVDDSHLRSERETDLFIIIYVNTPDAVLKISSHLNGMGFVWGEHYIAVSWCTTRPWRDDCASAWRSNHHSSGFAVSGSSRSI